MKTKKTNTAKMPAKTPIGEPELTNETVAPETSYKPGSRLAIPLKDDGSIDTETMRAATKEKLIAAIAATAELRPQQETVSSPMMFPPQVIFAMYSALGAVESMLAQRMAKVPKEIADKVFAYTAEELNLLGPPTSRVLAKYAADWMIKYQDEIALATLLTTITVSKVNAALVLSKMNQAPAPDPEKEPEPQPRVQ